MTCQVLTRPGRPSLVYEAFLPDTARPVFVFLSGYRADMTGAKASALKDWAERTSRNFIRFDYSGHGHSEGNFESCSLTDWIQDSRDILSRLILPGTRVILVGSSMGGWLALWLAQEQPGRISAVVGIAAAPDFTRLMQAKLTPAQRDDLARVGQIRVESAHGADPYFITQRLIAEGEALCLLDKTHETALPMILFQGGRDPSVPSDMPGRIARAFPRVKVHIELIPDGDHSLSRPEDLQTLCAVLAQLEEQIISGGN